MNLNERADQERTQIRRDAYDVASAENRARWLRSSVEAVLQDLLDAARATEGSPEANRLVLQQLARDKGVSAEILEQLQSTILWNKTGSDPEAADFSRLVQDMHGLETKIEDPGLRYYKMVRLAARYKLSVKDLRQAYDLALVNQSPLTPLSLSDLLSQAPDRREWLISGWVPRNNTVLIHSGYGVGKTTLVTDWLYHLTQGEPWNGWPVKQSKCLLIQSDEMQRENTILRFQDRGIPADADIAIEFGWTVERIPQLHRYLEQHRPDVLIIDSLTGINRESFISENDQLYCRPILKIAALCAEFGCTAILLHHSNAAGSARGSGAIGGAVDHVLALTKQEGSDRRVATWQKARLRGKLTAYQFDLGEDSEWILMGEDDTSLPGLAQGKQDLLKLLQSRPGVAFEAKEAANLIGMSESRCREYLRGLYDEGLCQRKASSSNRRAKAYFLDLPSDPEVLPNITSDRSDQSDRSAPENARSHGTATQQGIEPSDRSDRENVETPAPQNRDRFDHLADPPTPTQSQAIAPPSDRFDHFDHLSQSEILFDPDEIATHSAPLTDPSWGDPPPPH